MSIPVLTFFNNKGGVGKTTLVYHLAWMLTELGRSVFVVDLDPQANLTAAFLDEDQLIEIFDKPKPDGADTIYQCLQPLTRTGDIRDPKTIAIPGGPRLLPGDLQLSGFEEYLSTEWPNCLGSENQYRPFRVTTAFWQVMQRGAKLNESDIVLVDVGPSLGALNRSALIATDYVIVPWPPICSHAKDCETWTGLDTVACGVAAAPSQLGATRIRSSERVHAFARLFDPTAWHPSEPPS